MAAGKVAYLRPWKMQTGERHLERALELAASNATAHIFLAYVQCATGRTGRGFETMSRAQALDPLSVATNFHVDFHAWQGHDREAAGEKPGSSSPRGPVPRPGDHRRHRPGYASPLPHHRRAFSSTIRRPRVGSLNWAWRRTSQWSDR